LTSEDGMRKTCPGDARQGSRLVAMTWPSWMTVTVGKRISRLVAAGNGCEVEPGRRRAAARSYPPERRGRQDPHTNLRTARGDGPVQMRGDLIADESTVEGCGVGGVDRMAQVAGGEDAGVAGPQRGVHEWALGGGVERDAGGTG
jgi:hypothetical protein